MTTAPPRRSVLVIGASQRVLDETVTVLRDLGYTAQATSDFLGDIPGRFDVTRIDLVSLGGQVPSDRKTELRRQIAAGNPRVIFLDSLAGIPGLIAAQVQQAFTADRQVLARSPACTPGDRSVELTLADPAPVKVTAWWRTSVIPPDPKSESLVLLDGMLPSGKHTVPVPGHVFQPPRRSPNSPSLPPAVFASVQIGEAVYVFSIAAGQ